MTLGQHRIQRQILHNFSFAGHQPNSRNIWCLNTTGYRPSQHSSRRVGLFEDNCSRSVDDYITDVEDRFKNILPRWSHGEFEKADFGRDVYDFIALHYVRSLAFRQQIHYIVDTVCRETGLSYPYGEAEFKRLTSHQVVDVFRGFVDRVASALTHFLLCPIMITNSPAFVTSDKIIYAGMVESKERETVVWFPLSATAGLFLTSEVNVGQILGPRVLVDHQIGQLVFLPEPEEGLLRCQSPSPQEVDVAFVNTLNAMMVRGSKELYAANQSDIDWALRNAGLPTGYQYQPVTRD